MQDSIFKRIVLVVLGVSLVIVVQWMNGTPWMYKADYGDNIILFVIGGLAGTAVIYSISQTLSPRFVNPVVTLSKGMIVILGFHTFGTKLYSIVPDTLVIVDYIVAALILISFIPIIKFAEKHFPIILGMRMKR